MNYQFHAVTDPGRARDNNEDSVAFDEEALRQWLADGVVATTLEDRQWHGHRIYQVGVESLVD